MQALTGLIRMPSGRMLIDGQWVEAASGQLIDVEDPSDGSRIFQVGAGGKVEIDLAVAAGRRAFDTGPWSRMRPLDRGRLLEDIARRIEDCADELALLESYDNGKAVAHAKLLDLPATIDIFRYMGGWCSKIAGKTLPVSFDGRQYHAYTLRQPVGVVGAIVPWNYPLAMAAWKIAMALAAGCTVVLKPSEVTPLSALRLVEIIHEAGVPPGVVNIVTGYGAQAGQALAEHMDVDKVAFTGSTAVGKRIAQAALGNMKRVSLELGGKSPSIICADADIEQAIPGAALAIFFNSGQVCFAASRLYIHRSIYERVVEGIAQVARNFPVGHGRDPNTMLGPLVSKAQQDRVLRYVESGKAEGARLVTGGHAVGDKGYGVAPTVFADATPDMKIVREEIFGPVIAAMPFDDMEDVVRSANDSNYGLAANIWTRDLKTAHRTAARLNAGSVWINCHGIVDAALPFGGFKESGWGREVSEEGVMMYTETKSVCALLD
jgi:acyl-CoA reductase-like NAD-dependent aldehyde dehydrogenase